MLHWDAFASPVLSSKGNRYYIFWVCVCDLVVQRKMAYLAVQYFSTLSHKRQNFWKKKKVIEHKMCVLIFCTDLFETFPIWSRIRRHIINVRRSSCKVPLLLLLSNFNGTWLFSTDSRKMPKYQISWKSVQWETSCSVRTDGQTRDEANSRFSQFWERPKVTWNRNQNSW